MAEVTQGIILDIDGTLIDSNDAHARAWLQALQENGISTDYQTVRDKIGMGGDKLLPDVAQISVDSPLGKKIDQRKNEIFRQDFFPHLRPFPYAQQLIERLHASGLKLVVASSSSREDLDALLRKIGIADLIFASTSASDTEESKPAPDVVEAALHKADLRPHAAIMIGDTPYDISSAHQAHVPTIALTCGGWSRDELHDAEAIFASPKELFEKIKSFSLEEIPETLSSFIGH